MKENILTGTILVLLIAGCASQNVSRRPSSKGGEIGDRPTFSGTEELVARNALVQSVSCVVQEGEDQQGDPDSPTEHLNSSYLLQVKVAGDIVIEVQQGDPDAQKEYLTKKDEVTLSNRLDLESGSKDSISAKRAKLESICEGLKKAKKDKTKVSIFGIADDSKITNFKKD